MPTRGHCCLDLLILKDFLSLLLCTEDSFYSPHTIQGCGDALRSLCQFGFLVFVLYFVFVFFFFPVGVRKGILTTVDDKSHGNNNQAAHWCPGAKKPEFTMA